MCKKGGKEMNYFLALYLFFFFFFSLFEDELDFRSVLPPLCSSLILQLPDGKALLGWWYFGSYVI